jgi:hypothetical protein
MTSQPLNLFISFPSTCLKYTQEISNNMFLSIVYKHVEVYYTYFICCNISSVSHFDVLGLYVIHKIIF